MEEEEEVEVEGEEVVEEFFNHYTKDLTRHAHTLSGGVFEGAESWGEALGSSVRG